MRYACIKVVLSPARLMEVFFNTKKKNCKSIEWFLYDGNFDV